MVSVREDASADVDKLVEDRAEEVVDGTPLTPWIVVPTEMDSVLNETSLDEDGNALASEVDSSAAVLVTIPLEGSTIDDKDEKTELSRENVGSIPDETGIVAMYVIDEATLEGVLVSQAALVVAEAGTVELRPLLDSKSETEGTAGTKLELCGEGAGMTIVADDNGVELGTRLDPGVGREFVG